VLGNNSLTVSEGATVTLTAVDLGATDVDDPDPSLTFTVSSVASGQFELSSVPTTSFSQADVTAGNVSFVHDGSENPPAYDVTVSDGALSDGPNAATITFNPVNDEPSLALLGDQTVNEDSGPHTVAGFATALPGGGADEAAQTFTYTVGDDNNALFVAGPAIDASGELTYTLAASANGSATVTVFVTDSGGTANGGDDTSPSQTFTITVDAVNDEPSFTMLGDQTVIEDSGPHTVAGFATALPGGGADEAGQTFTYTVSDDNAALFTAGPAIDANGELTYTLAADASGSAALTVAVTDSGATANGGDDTSLSQTFAITVDAVNDAPMNTVPGAQVTNEDTALVFSASGGNAIGVSDVDSGAGPLEMTLSVNDGGLTLADTTGLLFTGGADGSASMTFTGTQAAINNSLDGLSYTPTGNFNGSDTLSVTTSDLGNTGVGGVLTDVRAVPITVAAVNDAPVVAVPGATTTAGSSALVFSVGNGNAISISDVDAAGPLEVTLSVSGGTLRLADTSGLTFSAGADGTATMTFTGSQTAINVALDGVTYSAAVGFVGGDSVTVVTSDLGSTGIGGAQTDVRAVAITFTPLNLGVNDLEPLEPPPVDDPVEQEVPEGNSEEIVELDPEPLEEMSEPSSDSSPIFPIFWNPHERTDFKPDVQLRRPGEVEDSDSSSELRRDSEALEFELSAPQHAARDLEGFETPAMQEALERLQREMALDTLRRNREANIVVSTAEGTTLVVAAGVAGMLLQRGTLMALALSSVPLWRRVDPLVVLALSDEEREKREEELRAAEAEEDWSNAEIGRILGGRAASREPDDSLRAIRGRTEAEGRRSGRR
jgi:hypothetical protein